MRLFDRLALPRLVVGQVLFIARAPTELQYTLTIIIERIWDQWVKSSIRTGYVDLSGTQIRLIFPYFRYCLDCCKKSSAEYSIPWEHDPGNFFFQSFVFFQDRHSTCHLCHTYIVSLFSPVTLARRRITNSHAPTRTKLLSFIHDSYFREEA